MKVYVNVKRPDETLDPSLSYFVHFLCSFPSLHLIRFNPAEVFRQFWFAACELLLL